MKGRMELEDGEGFCSMVLTTAFTARREMYYVYLFVGQKMILNICAGKNERT